MSDLKIGRWSLLRVAIVFVPLILLALLTDSAWVLNIGVFTLMYAGLATAWNLVGGYTGYITLGNVAFFGLGAYGFAIIFQHTGVGNGWWPFALVPVLGVAAGLISIPLGWLAYRTRALSFIIVTIVLVVVLQYLAFNLTSITGGPPGLSVPLPPFSPGLFTRVFYYAMLAVYALTVLVCWYVRRSRLGLMMFALRDDEDRAAGIGINVAVPKLTAFGVSAGLSAMFGVIWAYYLSNIYPQFAFDSEFLTMAIVLIAFLGGAGTLWGPTVGALILVPAQQYLAFTLGASDFYLLGYAAIFVVVMLTMRRGVVPSINDLMDRRRRRRRQEAMVAPKPMAVQTGRAAQ
ncbi:MAG: branched-chain amino acid ABC transporter permease [Streptosporangiaceae bacterium]